VRRQGSTGEPIKTPRATTTVATKSRSARDSQRLQARRFEPERGADEVEVAPEGSCWVAGVSRTICRMNHFRSGSHQAFAKEVSRLQGDCALSQAYLLACEALPG